MPALLLTLTKQGFFLIPLLLILAKLFWLKRYLGFLFPIADVASAIVTAYFLKKGLDEL